MFVEVWAFWFLDTESERERTVKDNVARTSTATRRVGCCPRGTSRIRSCRVHPLACRHLLLLVLLPRNSTAPSLLPYPPLSPYTMFSTSFRVTDQAPVMNSNVSSKGSFPGSFVFLFFVRPRNSAVNAAYRRANVDHRTVKPDSRDSTGFFLPTSVPFYPAREG